MEGSSRAFSPLATAAAPRGLHLRPLPLSLPLAGHALHGRLHAGHTEDYHPPWTELYHAGDKLRTDRDWGLHMLDTTRDMDKSSDTWGSLSKPIVFTTFGNHLLHHMFPA